MDDETVAMLLTEVQNAYPLFGRYLEAKRKLLHLDTMENIDIMAPIGSVEKEFNFDEAVDLHLSVMKDFDEEFYTYSKDMLQNGRVDAFPKIGKRGGAFASYSPGWESFVLLNHTNRLRDVSTLSHEMGHAIHGHLSQNQKPDVYHSPLCLAETASIFCEMLLSEKIKKSLTDEEKTEFLNEQLSDTFASIFRQIQYIAFEKRVHDTTAA